MNVLQPLKINGEPGFVDERSNASIIVTSAAINPVVVHTYQPVCRTVSQPPGLGDFMRGTVALFQWSRIYRFELRMDFTSHPLSQLIQPHDTIPGIGKQKVREFFNQQNSELEPYLAGLSGRRNVFVFTHAVPLESIDDDCRAFILRRLQPVGKLSAYLETVRTKLSLNHFCTVHLRMGDHLIGESASLLPIIDRWFRERIIPQWGTNILVISDNSGIKDALQKQFGIKIISTKPVHLGQCLPAEADNNDVHDTFAEFLLMAQSDHIYQYSVYPWGSGFSDLCAALFDVPLEKMTGELPASGRKIVMPKQKSNVTDGITRKVLNVGGNSKAIAIPACFDGWQHDLLDIDPRGNPDVLCDARELWKLPRQYDAVYCSHNLEHYLRHDVCNVLKGFRIILKKEGYALIKVPDIRAVMQRVVDEGLDIDDVLYHCNARPILVSDVLFGWHVEIERSGNDFFAHKTGFTLQSLERVLKENGFPFVFSKSENLEVTAFAFMQQPGEELIEQLGLTLHN